MENKRVYSFRGLNLRGSPINKEGDYAEDCDNVLLNSRREIVKRFGYDELADGIPFGSLTVSDTMVYNNSELIGVAARSLYKWDGSDWVNIRLGGFSVLFDWDKVDFAESNKCLYWTDATNAQNNLQKYDGYHHYRAGVPKPSISTSGGSGSPVYVRVFFGFVDMQGNITYGDYAQIESLSGATISVDNSTNSDGFYNKFGDADGTWPVDISNRSVTLVSGSNYQPNDWIYAKSITVDDDGNHIYVPLQIESRSFDVITFTEDSVGDYLFLFNDGNPIQERWTALAFVSENETYGYVGLFGANLDFYSSETDITILSPSAIITPIPMEDFYDTTVVKGLPPKSRYIAMYGETLVLANSKSQLGRSGQSNTTVKESTIAWSDTGLGSTVETFPPFNYQEIGDTDEGIITGIFSSENELIIFKDYQVYYINGILIGRSFRLTNALSGGIGCVSHKSIVEVQGGCLFQSERGIYFAGGGQSPIEITDIIEPLFTEDTTGLDLSSCRAVRDTKNERVYFYISASDPSDNLILVYDYYHKEWFKFSNYDASNGFSIVRDQIYHVDSSKLYSWSNTYNDNGAAIDAFYQSVFHHFGIPALNKKFTRATILSIGAEAFTCYIKTRKNWKSVDDTDLTYTFDSSKDLEDKPVNLTNARSMSVIFGNNTLNEGMLINGYEIEFMPNQRNVKGDT